MGGGKRLFQFLYPTKSLKTSTRLTNLDNSINAFKIKPITVRYKLPLFVIGKTKKPRCFKNVKFLPCCYSNQQKQLDGWVLFEEWSERWTSVSEGKKSCVSYRQFLCSSSNWELKIDQVVILPRNATSQTKPVDQAVIKSLKAQCCENVVLKINHLKKRTPAKISLLLGM